MEDDASHAEPISVSSSTHTIPQQENSQEQVIIPSFNPSSAPSSPTPTGTLSRLGLRSPTSPTATAAAPGSPADRGQVSAITVVALLDKLVNMLEAVQDNQQRMEQRQGDLEDAVKVVQGEVSRLSKTHVSTSNSVSKLLERSRKVSGHLKEVRERLDKQAVQVKKLEANHGHLLKRNNFKVLIFQEDNEIPASVLVKDSLKTPQPSQYDAESTQQTPSVAGSVEGIQKRPEECLQSISLSSDEEGGQEQGSLLEFDEGMGPSFERRADRFKRNSLKKVDSLKKAFSRQSIEKKVNQITTKIVPPEKREKIKKSFTPNHPKSPTAKASSFKVSPMTFNVKKVRDGESPMPDASGSPREEPKEVHVEIPPLGSIDGESQQDSAESLKAELAVNERPSFEYEMNGDHPAGLAIPESVEDDVDGEDEEEEEDKEQQKIPVETPADAQMPTAAALEQTS